ncbi:hypothetical protein [Nocardia sp. NPDC049149]|uniref:hypothetical protein n=1 Tax=Nocardia sp. NPDC049149 TaxID=3364315 RepID=UPI003712709F
MKLDRIITLTAAAALLSAGFAGTATAEPDVEIETSWSKQWQSTIDRDYLVAHGNKWQSQNFSLPGGSNQGRAVFKCTGGGDAKVSIKNLNTGQVHSKTHNCNGDRHHVDPVAYRSGEALRIFIDRSSKTTTIEAWAGR